MTDASSLAMPSGASCAFCAYLDGTRPFTTWFKNDLVAGLVTREQRGIAHVLILPVKHRESILDVTDAESQALMVGIRRAARAIDWAEHRPGIAVWQNNGLPAHQTIPHLHFHVAGTLPGQATNWGDVRELALSETDVIAEKLRRAEIEHST
jgi:histidine triad (HIT) family protein